MAQCLSGSIDQGANGDGRWKIHWHAVQCNVGSSSFLYSFQGSNDYYVKMNVANARVPVASVSIQAWLSLLASPYMPTWIHTYIYSSLRQTYTPSSAVAL